MSKATTEQKATSQDRGIIQILRDRGYKDIPDIKEFAKSEDQLNV